MTTNRVFDTGATRSPDNGRDDPEGFLSPIALERFCQYMTKHRRQADGTLRDSDNWQKGIPLDVYMKGMFRHFHHAWSRHRGFPVADPMAAADIEEDLCAIWFGLQGYLHQLLIAKLVVGEDSDHMVISDTDGQSDVSTDVSEPTHRLFDFDKLATFIQHPAYIVGS